MTDTLPREDYATDERLAIYLEAGWSDFLYDEGVGATSRRTLPYPNPVVDLVPPNFSRAVAGLSRQWTTDISLDVRNYCDVGGATGRTLYEVNLLFSGLTTLALVEPSSAFCEWATYLLATDIDLPDVPLIDAPGLPRWVKAASRPNPIGGAGERLIIRNETLEQHDPDGGYDLVTCLNVIDRHPRPRDIISQIERYMNKGGLLLVSCPFDFQVEATPDRADWISDINALFAGRGSWEHVGEDELYYEYRSHRRSWCRLTTQVVGKRWKN